MKKNIPNYIHPKKKKIWECLKQYNLIKNTFNKKKWKFRNPDWYMFLLNSVSSPTEHNKNNNIVNDNVSSKNDDICVRTPNKKNINLGITSPPANANIASSCLLSGRQWKKKAIWELSGLSSTAFYKLINEFKFKESDVNTVFLQTNIKYSNFGQLTDAEQLQTLLENMDKI